MLLKFDYVNSRTYITTSTFVDYIIQTEFPDCDSVKFLFHKITENSLIDFEISDIPFDKNIYNITGSITSNEDIKYFGFKENKEKLETRIAKIEYNSLSDVKFENMAITFVNHFRIKCEPYYNKLTERMLMAKISFKNLNIIPSTSNFTFEITRIKLPNIYSKFYYNGIEVCEALLVARNKL